MPRPSAFDAMPPTERLAFAQEFERRNFRDLDGMVEWLAERGWEVGRGAVWRAGGKVKRRLEAVRNSTEAARMIAEAAPDDADLRSAAVISMVQSEMFELLLNLQEADEADDPAARVELMAKAAKGRADLSRASIAQKKWQEQVRAKLDKLEREASSPTEGKRRLDAESLRAVRQEIYGLAA